MREWVLDNIMSLIGYIFGGTSLLAYFSEKRKRRIEEKQLTTDALKSMQEAYDKFAEHFNTNYRELLAKYQELTAKYSLLEEKYLKVEKELLNLKNKN